MGYAEWAPKYWELGWRGILPIRPNTKGPVPEKWSGYGGAWPSYADILTWAEDRPDASIALRLPPGVIAIDVDNYIKDGKQKQGGRTLAHAIGLWGKLPPTWASTSRTDGVSGIRLFRVPDKTRLVTKLGFELGAGQKFGDIEVIQWYHRYMVVGPSVNPDTRREYQWMTTDELMWCDAPRIDDLAWLPDTWLEGMAAPEVENVSGIDVDVPALLSSMPDGPMDASVHERLDEALGDLDTSGSRHDTTLQHVMCLLRYAHRGEIGVPRALKTMAKAYAAAVGGDRPGGRAAAEAEFWRMVTNPRGWQMIAANPTESNVEEVDFEELTREVQSRAQSNQSEQSQESNTPELEVFDGVAARGPAWRDMAMAESAATDEAAAIEVDPFEEFWFTRDSLEQVRQWAFARMCSPWAVLGVVLARTLATVPPWVTLPPLIGGKGSLNFFVALVGRSGGGKGASESCASEVLPVEVYTVPAGSGEGLAHQYAHMEKGSQVIDRHSVLFSVPEVDTLTALGGRTGSTIMSKLREAFSGEELGFGYADAQKRIRLGKHGYRLCMVVGVQPTRAQTLLSDGAGGTPQRFLWLPATDPAITLHGRPEVPEPLRLFADNYWNGGKTTIRIPDSVAEEILQAHVDRQRGNGDALDGHALFVREKVAFALAVLDGREYVDEDDWELAGIVMEMSNSTRDGIELELREVAREENDEKARSLGVQRAIADEIVHDKKVQTVSDGIVRAIKRGATSPLEIKRSIWSKNRDYYEPAMAGLIESGCVVVADGVASLTEFGRATKTMREQSAQRLQQPSKRKSGR